MKVHLNPWRDAPLLTKIHILGCVIIICASVVGKYQRFKVRMRHPFAPRTSNGKRRSEGELFQGEGCCTCGHPGTSSGGENVDKPEVVGGDREAGEADGRKADGGIPAGL